ncbi:LysR family transcriptional regulator [Roseibium sp. SCPC15]|uniref:LysR family transcriptional regulator n=1 Tax=Roseibium sp. SCP15 TaxID=3141376 RepID=UPI003339EF3D
MTRERELLNLRHVRIFLEVARGRGVSAAAAAVNLSQPAITQAIAKLEATFQQKLFDRRSKGMFVTEAGGLLQERAHRALDLIGEGCALAFRKQARSGAAGYGKLDQLVTSTQLRALLAVEHSGNFSLAARHIGVSQPSLHRVARDLEAATGLTLFVTSRQGIDLTDAAKVLAQYSKLAYAELRSAFEEIDATRGLETTRIVVGSLPLARSRVLPQAINTLTAAHPSVQISVVDGPYDDLLHGLRHGEIDLMIGALRFPSPIDDVEQKALFTDYLGVFARTGHPLAGRLDVTIDDLATFPWIVPRSGTPTRSHFDTLFRKAGREPPKHVVDTGSLILLRGVLRGSDRLALISVHQMQDDVDNGQVIRVPFDLPDTERPIGITTRVGWRPTSMHRRFMELLRESAGALA